MRVISGTARRIQLDTPKGLDTRPTTDRIKETLFNMIGLNLIDCTFLDLFAGSGQIGIEALSRQAKECVFVDYSDEAIHAISNNLDRTHLKENAVVMKADVHRALAQLNGREPFDYIFMDPPYNNDFEKSILEKLSTMSFVDNYTTIIVEADINTDFSYASNLNFTITKEKIYKTNKHIFLKKA